MQAYTNWQAPLWRDESRTTKHFDIPLNGRFELLSPHSVNGLWQVEYTSNGKAVTGWIADKYLEIYNQNLNSNLVDLSGLQTPDPNDAQQYIFWDGVKQVNMCGEICAAYILGVPLETVLRKWKTVDLPFYKRVFGSGKAVGTGTGDLIKLFGLFGQTSQPITLTKYTPRIFAEMVATQKGVIVSCRLNTQTGALNGSGVLHWVIVTGVVVERMDMGWVHVFNPYSNSIELYSWREFIATTRSPYGVIA